MNHRVLFFVALLPCLSAQAQEPLSVERGIGLQMEDALPLAQGSWEFQSFGSYQRFDGGNQWQSELRVEYGLWNRWEVSIGLPFKFGSSIEDEGMGDLELGALYQILREGGVLPALSFAGAVRLPTASRSDGFDTIAAVLATKTLPGRMDHRLHFNAVWFHDTDPPGDDRANSLTLIAGYDVEASERLLLLFDLVAERTVYQGVDFFILELGLRGMISPSTALGAGLGLGLTGDSPDLRVNLGLQLAF